MLLPEPRTTFAFQPSSTPLSPVDKTEITTPPPYFPPPSSLSCPAKPVLSASPFHLTALHVRLAPRSVILFDLHCLSTTHSQTLSPTSLTDTLTLSSLAVKTLAHCLLSNKVCSYYISVPSALPVSPISSRSTTNTVSTSRENVFASCHGHVYYSAAFIDAVHRRCTSQ